MSITYYVQIILSLLIFSIFLWGVLRVSKQYYFKKFSGEIKVKDRMPLDNQVVLLIVEIRGKEYLFSIGGKDINLIDRLGDHGQPQQPIVNKRNHNDHADQQIVQDMKRSLSNQ